MKKWINLILCLSILIFLCITIFILYLYNIIPHASYTAYELGIETIISDIDKDNDGINDYTDILFGAKAEIQRDPMYHSAYYIGGYPPAEEGVCTDVIWRSLKEAGYDIKELIDEDIKHNVDAYPRVMNNPDPNIDFRRVPNMAMYLKRHTISLTLDLDEVAKWQPGDIVVFSDTHIGILSDLRNSKGVPYLLHNGNLPVQEEDALEREAFLKGIRGHYRFRLTNEKEVE